MKFTRTKSGLYQSGDWTIGTTEGEDRAPGYEWFVHHHDKGEFHTRTLRAAKAEILKIESEAKE